MMYLLIRVKFRPTWSSFTPKRRMNISGSCTRTRRGTPLTGSGLEPRGTTRVPSPSSGRIGQDWSLRTGGRENPTTGVSRSTVSSPAGSVQHSGTTLVVTISDIQYVKNKTSHTLVSRSPVGLLDLNHKTSGQVYTKFLLRMNNITFLYRLVSGHTNISVVPATVPISP